MAPFTCDVIHLIFTCCGADLMSEWTELLNDYYDYIKVSSLVLLVDPLQCFAGYYHINIHEKKDFCGGDGYLGKKKLAENLA